jgi:hypothetical protein
MNTAEEPRSTLAFALEKYPQRVEVVPLQELVMESARENPRRPAYVKLALPDEAVKQLRGGDSGGDLLLLVRVPKEVQKRSESSIVLPGEV